ncbi:hypothetical protein L1987_70339 [Smallanthus sonchifolius]|uniref:Uncharacterized protein n=1 Tax=Smallanthus sonchifolius TaxID=185202 RepID=A0ACB9APM3_9ASTR|nr:hypothetical protein L1987_70339 [Smallanthus sonchifolius]
MTGFASLHARLLPPKPYRLSLTPLQSQNVRGFDDGVEEEGDCGSATARAREREVLVLDEDGSSKVQVGQTQVIAFVMGQLVQSLETGQIKGLLQFVLSSRLWLIPHLNQVIPGDSAIELGRMVDRGLSHRKHALMNDLDKTLDDVTIQMDQDVS